MKKSLVLGAAALATLLMAAPQNSQAGEVKMGGNYMFRMQDSDSNPGTTTGTADDTRAWHHRLQLNMDFIQDKTTHAHLVTRVMDSQVVEGADSTGLGLGGQITTSANWNLRKAWLETDMWGVGVKVGNMPVSLNDDMLVSSKDDTGFGAVMLSKTFGDVSVVLADVRAREGNTSGYSVAAQSAYDAAVAAVAAGTETAAQTALAANGRPTAGSNEDNEDVYVLALFGKVDQVNYGVTGAYYKTGDYSTISSAVGTAGNDVSDGWVALTLNTVLGGVNVTATGIYETGMSGINGTTRSQADAFTGIDTTDAAAVAAAKSTNRSTIQARRLDDSGFLGFLRLDGDLPVLAQGAKWNAYGLWSGEGFTNITNDEKYYSETWDIGGPGGPDLLKTWAVAAGGSQSENMRAVGASVSVPVQGWTIKPMIDYAHVEEDTTFGGSNADYRTSSAWGGGLAVSTKLNAATTFGVTGIVVDPNDKGSSSRDLGSIGNTDTMHVVEAHLKMTF
ncbi:MAG: hypothetical protein HQL90_14760 [Magnetococcales bacterium]|nr:hypothetical protein [Magnetococcales bacterium]